MRTRVNVDSRLVSEAMRLSSVPTADEVVALALREWIARRQQKSLRDLVGTGLIAPEYDIAAVRRGMDRRSR